MESFSSLINKETKSRVSSVQNMNTKEYGKQLMFDGNDDTCWNSDQGDHQFIELLLKPCEIKRIEIISQGGFCPKVFFK